MKIVLSGGRFQIEYLSSQAVCRLRRGSIAPGQSSQCSFNQKKTGKPIQLNSKLHLIMCLAVPGKILSIAGDDPYLRNGRVSFSGIVKEVNLAFTPEAKVGDYVIVHVGFALSTVDENEALLIFDYLKQMGDLSQLAEPEEGSVQ